MADYPFKLKIHKIKNDGLAAEVQSVGVIDISHQLIGSIGTFLKRYNYVILNLGNASAISYTVDKTFKALKNLNKLVVVAEKDKQIGFDFSEALRFSTVEGALKVLNCDYDIVQAIRNFHESALFKRPVFQIIKLVQDPQINFETLSETIRKDESISQTVLDCANATQSEADGGKAYTEVKNVLALHGLEGIRLMLLEYAFSFYEQVFMAQSSDKIKHMHFMITLMERVARLLGLDRRIVRKLRVAGLYHDIGSLFIRHIFAKDYSSVYNFTGYDVSVADAEYRALGVSHQEVGEIVGYRLGLPDYIMSSVGKHHNREVSPTDVILNSTIICNGFLNSEVEHISYTPYKSSVTALDAEYKKLFKERPEYEFMKAKREQSDAENAENTDRNEAEDEEIISPFRNIDNVKQELNREYSILIAAMEEKEKREREKEMKKQEQQ